MQPYIAPFLVYLAFSFGADFFDFFPDSKLWVYPIKTIAVALTLWHYRKTYRELTIKVEASSIFRAIIVGILVFVAWVAPDNLYPHLGSSQYNPFAFEDAKISWFLAIFRIAGATLVVPVFEELFWRSFLIRWIVNPDFTKIKLGHFTWFSFIIVTVFFGFEHNRWLVGLSAGVAYNLLLYKEKNIMPCIVSHAITNFLLGLYVLQTQEWSFW